MLEPGASGYLGHRELHDPVGAGSGQPACLGIVYHRACLAACGDKVESAQILDPEHAPAVTGMGRLSWGQQVSYPE